MASTPAQVLGKREEMAPPDFPETFRCAQKRTNSKSPISQMSRQNNLNFCQPAGNTETDKYAQIDMQKYRILQGCSLQTNGLPDVPKGHCLDN